MKPEIIKFSSDNADSGAMRFISRVLFDTRSSDYSNPFEIVLTYNGKQIP